MPLQLDIKTIIIIIIINNCRTLKEYTCMQYAKYSRYVKFKYNLVSVRPKIANCLFPILVRQKIPCGRAVIIYYIVKIYYLISRILKGAH